MEYGYLYKITNKLVQNNKGRHKAYIGKSGASGKARIRKHLTGKGNRLIRDALSKHDESAFQIRILSSKIPVDELNDWEARAIKHYQTKVPLGYNLTDGGDGLVEITDETRARLREKKLGNKNPNFGKKHSEETRRKMSEAKRGKREVVKKEVIDYESRIYSLLQTNELTAKQISKAIGLPLGGVNNMLFSLLSKNLVEIRAYGAYTAIRGQI